MFMDTKNEHELALPILIGKSINSSLIEKGEIEKFQKVLLSRYCNSYEKKDLQLIKFFIKFILQILQIFLIIINFLNI